MKIEKSITKFVFNKTDRGHLTEVDNIITLMYNAMGEDETFLGYDEDFINNAHLFFEDFIYFLDKGADEKNEQFTIKCE